MTVLLLVQTPFGFAPSCCFHQSLRLTGKGIQVQAVRYNHEEAVRFLPLIRAPDRENTVYSPAVTAINPVAGQTV